MARKRISKLKRAARHGGSDADGATVIRFRCPSGHKLKASPEKAGQKILCPACQQSLIIPQATEEKPPRLPGGTVAPPPLPSVRKKKVRKKPPLKRDAHPAAEKSQAPAEKEEAAAKPLQPERPKKKRKRRALKFGEPADKTPAAAPALRSAPAKDMIAATAPSAPPLVESPPAEKSASPPASANSLATVAQTTALGLHADQPAAPPVEAPPLQYEPTNEPARGYRPDPGKITSVRWLGAVLAAITIVGMLPLQGYTSFSMAPTWAQLLLMLSVLQFAYIVWMISVPDWSTVRVLMLVYTISATLYGFLLAVVIMTPMQRPLLFMMDNVRVLAPAWCGAMLLMTFLGAFACGRFSFRWHKGYVLAAAGHE